MTKKSNVATYIALVPVYSMQAQRDYQPGEAIEWDLNGEFLPDFETLIALGIIAPANENKEIRIEEVGNATDSFDSTAD